MNSIFSYSDYQKFLKDWIAAAKRADRSFTYTKFASRAGFKSPGFLTQVLQGKSNLTPDMAMRFASVLELGKKETEYLLGLVAITRSKTHKEKSASAERLLSAKPVRITKVEKAQFEFYKKWYYSAIRSLLGYYSFDGDYNKLSRMLSPVISAAEAKKAIKLLCKLDIIAAKPDGTFALQNRMITSGSEHHSVAVVNYQLEAMDLAKRAVQDMPKEKRTAATLTLGLSAQSQKIANEKIATLRKELMELAASDSNIDRVIQVNLHAFPLTNIREDDK